MTENLDDQLAKLKELLKEYNALSIELTRHHNDEELQHRINELNEKIVHLEEIHREKNRSDEDQKKHFLQHHFEAARHATDHWHHVAHHMMHIFEAKELLELHEKLRQLIEEIEREKNELARLEAKKAEALHLREK